MTPWGTNPEHREHTRTREKTTQETQEQDDKRRLKYKAN